MIYDTLMDGHKTELDEKNTDLQSQIGRSFNVPFQQTSLPKPPPLLEFKIQKDKIKKDSVEQKAIQKGIFNNPKDNTTGIPIQKAIIQYPLYTDKVIDYYRQIIPPYIQLFLDSLKLQKDYIDALQPQWVDHMRTTVENYLVFQDKMILHYIQNYNTYLNRFFDIDKKNNNNKRTNK